MIMIIIVIIIFMHYSLSFVILIGLTIMFPYIQRSPDNTFSCSKQNVINHKFKLQTRMLVAMLMIE